MPICKYIYIYYMSVYISNLGLKLTMLIFNTNFSTNSILFSSTDSGTSSTGEEDVAILSMECPPSLLPFCMLSVLSLGGRELPSIGDVSSFRSAHTHRESYISCSYMYIIQMTTMLCLILVHNA